MADVVTKLKKTQFIPFLDKTEDLTLQTCT